MSKLQINFNKSADEKTEEKLQEIILRPENRFCADCRERDPRWSSWNIGILVCINCSGKHRGLGVHISKVKSVDLDKWTPEQVENLSQWGNYKSNLYWEAHLPKTQVQRICQNPDFIRLKYEGKKYVSSPTRPKPETLASYPGSNEVKEPRSESSKKPNKFVVFPSRESNAPQINSNISKVKPKTLDFDPFSLEPATHKTSSAINPPDTSAEPGHQNNSIINEDENNWSEFYDAKN